MVKWLDNRSVIVASTKRDPKTTDIFKRYSKPDKGYIQISRPEIIKHYNINMGGVDLLHRLISCYRSYDRTKRWPVRMFEHFMDMTIVNCCIQYSKDVNILKQAKVKYWTY